MFEVVGTKLEFGSFWGLFVNLQRLWRKGFAIWSKRRSNIENLGGQGLF
jgi:hypothetical protein